MPTYQCTIYINCDVATWSPQSALTEKLQWSRRCMWSYTQRMALQYSHCCLCFVFFPPVWWHKMNDAGITCYFHPNKIAAHSLCRSTMDFEPRLWLFHLFWSVDQMLWCWLILVSFMAVVLSQSCHTDKWALWQWNYFRGCQVHFIYNTTHKML